MVGWIEKKRKNNCDSFVKIYECSPVRSPPRISNQIIQIK